MSFARFTGSRPIVAGLADIPLPISEDDILAALGPHIVAIPHAVDIINDIVTAQVVMRSLPPYSSDYVARFANIQRWMRCLGLYPTAQAAGPVSNDPVLVAGS